MVGGLVTFNAYKENAMKVNENFVLREIYGTAILMPIRKNDVSDSPLYLNEVATVIWKQAVLHIDLNELLISLRKIYQIERDTEEDKMLIEFILQLFDMKLLLA